LLGLRTLLGFLLMKTVLIVLQSTTTLGLCLRVMPTRRVLGMPTRLLMRAFVVNVLVLRRLQLVAFVR
jgi:hypothetical protein